MTRLWIRIYLDRRETLDNLSKEVRFDNKKNYKVLGC